MDEPRNRLTDDRLDAIENSARKHFTLGDRVKIEMVHEIRRLRAIVAKIEKPPS